MIGSTIEKEVTPLLTLAVGLNQVDKNVIDGWNDRLNLPTKEAEKQIERRADDIVAKLSAYSNLSVSHIEYYSALKRYRLENLLSKVIMFTRQGFRLDDVEPQPWWDLAEEDVREFILQERQKRQNPKEALRGSKEYLFEELQQLLPADVLKQVKDEFHEVRRTPAKVAILGKAGVGKTTTVNNLFNAQWKTSHTFVGTTEMQADEFSLPTGGTLTVIDLPGYGRSLAEDRQYESIYREVIKYCDLVLLIIQANSRDLADDQEMICKLSQWLKEFNSSL